MSSLTPDFSKWLLCTCRENLDNPYTIKLDGQKIHFNLLRVIKTEHVIISWYHTMVIPTSIVLTT